MKQLKIRVPATVTGLGPGIGTLGLALDLTDTVHVELDPESTGIEGDEALCAAYRRWPADQCPGVRFRLERGIPPEKGLGDDTALAVAGLAATAFATETKNARPQILSLAAGLGCNPAHVGACVMGGMTATIRDEGETRALTIANHLNLGIALFLPENPSEPPTSPHTISMRTAVEDLGRLSYLITALLWGRWDLLDTAMQVALTSMTPQQRALHATAREAGACGSAPSGSTSTFVAFTPFGQAEAVAQAMKSCADREGWQGSTITTAIREPGLQIQEIKPETP